MILLFRRARFLLVVFFVRMWLACDLEYTIFPVPVVLKRFAAPRFVFIFGIFLSSFLGFDTQSKLGGGYLIDTNFETFAEHHFSPNLRLTAGLRGASGNCYPCEA